MNPNIEQNDTRFEPLYERLIKLSDSVSIDDPRIMAVIKSSILLFECKGWFGATLFCESIQDNLSKIDYNSVNMLRHLIHMAYENNYSEYQTYEDKFRMTLMSATPK